MAEKFQRLKLPKYTYEFLKHLNKFILKAQLINDDQRPVIAISGGVDSVALAYSIYLIWKNKLGAFSKRPRLLHIDHGTRKEIKDEVQYLSSWSKSLNMDFLSVEIGMDLEDSNFESEARQKRYEVFNDYLESDEVLLTAHHIDDSFEWTLMQQFKSSSLVGTLGIPVKGPKLARPFMCVTKKQVVRFAKQNDLKWFEDVSNTDLRFERNYIRDLIKNSIEKRYPQYLKHYVHKQSKLASKLGKSCFTKPNFGFTVHERDWGCIIIYKGKLSINETEVLDLINSHSSANRGKTHEQFNKLIDVINKNKAFTGPMSFSGGVKVYHHQGHVFIVKKDRDIILHNNAAQIPDSVPYLKKATKKTTLKSPIPMTVSETEELLKNNVPFHFAWRIKKGEILFWI